MLPSSFFVGKTVLITGASAGLGEEFALQCARAGAKLALLARREDKLAQLASACKAQGAPSAVPIKCDVTDRLVCKSAVAQAVAALGRIDVLILNAGSSQGCYFEDIKSLEDADYMMKLNVMGVFNILHFALPSVPKQPSSRICFIGSISGAAGIPLRTIYCSTKWAVNGFANALRVELGDAYGAKSPQVVTLNPPEVQSELNGNRLQFGAGKPAESLPSSLRPTDTSVTLMLNGIEKGVRVQYFSMLQTIMARIYPCCPAPIDRLVLKKVKKSHEMNGQGRG